MTRRCLFAVLGAAALAAGCGPKAISVPKTAPVAGSVTFKGRPAAGYRVTFHPRFDIGAVKFTPSGETDAAGRFTLSTGAAGDGAPPGEYAVTVVKPKVVSDRTAGGLETEVDDLKGKYADPAAGAFVVRVTAGANTLDPFRLD